MPSPGRLNEALAAAADELSLPKMRAALAAGADPAATVNLDGLPRSIAEIILTSNYEACVWLDGDGNADAEDARRFAALKLLGRATVAPRATELLLTAVNVCGGYMVQRLISAGADVRRPDVRPQLLHSVHRGSAARALIAAGADVTARDADGDTCLTAAVRGGRRPSLVAALIEGGADLDATNHAESTALHLAARNVCRGLKEEVATLETLLAHGADPSICDASGRTPLQEVVSDVGVVRRCTDVVAPLLTVARLLAPAAAWRRRRHLLLAVVRGRHAAGRDGASAAAEGRGAGPG